ncbi:MAG TPA: hypothetical protein GX529_10285, partial [Firmicutes bacterium]|nr:hypothetical protein [Candidatus Fermentithermobacillaceae bacterium]
KKEYTPIPVYDGTVVIDYGSNGAVRLLHWLDTYRLSHSTVFGQGLTGDKKESEDINRLKEILEKSKEANPEERNALEKEAINIGKRVFGEKYLNKILNPANTKESWRVEKEFDEANRFENGKINKNGNKPNIPLAQAM